LPLGLLCVLVVYDYNILRYHRDWLIRKRTLVVGLGIARSLDIGVMLTVAAFSSFILASSFGSLPLWTLLSLGGLPLVLGGFSDFWRAGRRRDDLPNLYSATVNGVIVTGILFCVSLILDRLL
jgi:1,4-dihydroxy-2-naphthoate octaprenyltransferase